MGGEGLAEGLGGAYEALKKRLWPESAERAIVPTGNPRTTWSPTSETPYRMGGSTSYETAGRKFPGPDATPPLDILATPTSGTGVAEGTASAQTPQAQEWFSGARKGSIEPDYPARPPIRVQSSPSTDALLERADPGAAVTRTRPTASETVDAASRDASGTGFLETPRWVGDVGVEIRDAFNKLNEKLKKNWW
jgi:hypothetical protein